MKGLIKRMLRRMLFDEIPTNRSARLPEGVIQTIVLEYPLKPVPRYGYDKPAHGRLYEILDQGSSGYKDLLEGFLKYADYFKNIQVTLTDEPKEPVWINEWMPGMDSVALYSFLASTNPEQYFEVGSGTSTKFARKAISDHGLRTKITSVDPEPRAEIDAICDKVIRQRLEDMDVDVFRELRRGDILYIDNSHYCFMNSDVTTVFLDIFPLLDAGVLVQLHDIFLPYDYPSEWGLRCYSEQYLLAVQLLSGGGMFEIVLPNMFCSHHPELKGVLDPLWEGPSYAGVHRHGCSFWMRKKV